MTDNPMTAPPKLEPRTTVEPWMTDAAAEIDREQLQHQGRMVPSRMAKIMANHLAARLSQPSAPGVDADWVLVPREPTELMFHGAWRAINLTYGQVADRPHIAAAYRAMLSAAPKPPETK